MRLSLWKPTLLVCLALAGCRTTSAPPAADSPSGPMAEPLPFDPGVRRGTLANGLTYYVEQNSEPQTRAELRLVVKAGSINESDDQLGLAHVVEHMAFNGTEHFSGNELIDYLESVGVQFGAHLNAYTSFDETVYQLQVPTDEPELLDRGLLVLSDWAGGITFEPEEVEKERGVVLEEWRRTRGASGRLQDQLMPLNFKDSRYKDRLPIGTENSLRTFTREQLVRFYHDWYRPELMAVIAVGDFEPQRVEAQIKKIFAGLENPADGPKRTYAAVPSDHTPIYGVFTDPEIPQTALNVSIKVDDTEGRTYGDYRELLIEQMVAGIFNERMAVETRAAETPLLGGGAGKRRVTPIKAAYTVGAAAKEGRATEALEVVLTELRRLQQLGVSEAELERARKRMLASYASYYNERDKTSSSTHAQELVRVFTTGEPAPGVEKETEIARELLAGISKKDLDAFAADFLPDTGWVVTVIMPEKEGLEPPTEEALAAVMQSVREKRFTTKDDAFVERPLLAELPEPGTIVTREPVVAIGAERWVLSNGMTVLVKPTDFKDDQVLLSAMSWGGTATASDAQFPSARAATAIALQSGLADWDAVELSRALAGRRVSSSSGVSEQTESVSGASSVEDLETLFQLTYLRFTSPRLDLTGYELFVEQRKEAIRNRLDIPETWFSDKYRELMWRGYSRYEPWTEVSLAAVELDAARAFYEARFQDAADFLVVIVGNLTKEQLEPLVRRYLASLPGDPASREAPIDTGATRNSDSASAVVRRGLESKAQARLTWHGPFDNTRENRYLLSSVVDVLSERLREELREQLGGTYSVGAQETIREEPVSDYAISIAFQSDPARVRELLDRAKAIVDAMQQTAPPTEQEVETLKAKQRRSRETSVRTNGFWLGAMMAYERRGEPLEAILEYDALVDGVTPAKLQAAAKRWFERTRAVEVILLPESEAPAG